MRIHSAALGVIPPSVTSAQATPVNYTCAQIAARARQLRCGTAMKAGSGAPASTRQLCATLRNKYRAQSCKGTGDLVPAVNKLPWNAFRPGMGDLVSANNLLPYNAFTQKGMGCASCDQQGMGDLSTVGADISAGNFSQAWTDLQAYMSTLSPTFGPYIIPGAAIGLVALAFMGGNSSKGKRR